MVCLYNNNKYQSQSVRTAHFVRLVSLQIGKKAYFFPPMPKKFFGIKYVEDLKKILYKIYHQDVIELKS